MRDRGQYREFWRRPLPGYGLAVAAAGVGFLARLQVDHALPPGFPFLTFFPAVILTAYVAGLGPGIVCSVLSGLASWYFFIPPANSFALSASTGVALGFYSFIVGVDLLIIHVMNQALDRLRAERQLTATLYDQQKTMFQELQHRVANNMAFIASLLTLEKRRSTSPEQAAALESAIGRIETMSRLHRRLYDPGASNASIETHLRETVADLIDMAGRTGVELAVDAPDVQLELSRLITLSMLVSELAMNSLKHAFGEGPGGRISVSLVRLDDLTLELSVGDNGCGIQEGQRSRGGLGSRIVENLGTQLGGKVRIESGPGGVTTRLAFPAA
jgi:two-component sensor histidine kinase